MALICETVMVDNMRDLRRGRDASSADLVELRLDGVADVDVAGALEGRGRPVLLTCRAAWEGGRFNGSEEARLRILGQAIAGGAEYVDIEWRAERQSLPQIDPSRLVLSHHDFSGLPADLASRIRSMRSANPSGIVKAACTVGTLADLVRLRNASADAGGRRIVIGMGSAGLLSRVCPGVFGSEWTYGGSAAPGQLSMNELTRLYRVRSQSKSSRLFAITGMPLGHSASPAMHNAAFEAAGIDAVYVPLETDDARALLDVATTFGVEGVSVTAPLKSAWPALGVEIDTRGRAIGAVNTLSRRGNQWSGKNFDVEGFLAPLRDHGVALAGRRCVVLGAGGAARAAVWALVREGARVEISARHRAGSRDASPPRWALPRSRGRPRQDGTCW